MKQTLFRIDCCFWFLSLFSTAQSLPFGQNLNLSRHSPTKSYLFDIDSVCVYDDVTYTAGENFTTSNPCQTCVCNPPGYTCTFRSCDLKPGCKAIHTANKCCPEYLCECEKNGKIYSNGEKVEEPNPCKVCYCKGGEIKCALVRCYSRSDCEPIYVSGRCCPKYDHCPPLETTKNKSTTPKPDLVTISDLDTLLLNASLGEGEYSQYDTDLLYDLTTPSDSFGNDHTNESTGESTKKTKEKSQSVATLEIIEIYPTAAVYARNLPFDIRFGENVSLPYKNTDEEISATIDEDRLSKPLIIDEEGTNSTQTKMNNDNYAFRESSQVDRYKKSSWNKPKFNDNMMTFSGTPTILSKSAVRSDLEQKHQKVTDDWLSEIDNVTQTIYKSDKNVAEKISAERRELSKKRKSNFKSGIETSLNLNSKINFVTENAENYTQNSSDIFETASDGLNMEFENETSTQKTLTEKKFTENETEIVAGFPGDKYSTQMQSPKASSDGIGNPEKRYLGNSTQFQTGSVKTSRNPRKQDVTDESEENQSLITQQPRELEISTVEGSRDLWTREGFHDDNQKESQTGRNFMMTIPKNAREESSAPGVIMISADQMEYLQVGEQPPLYVDSPELISPNEPKVKSKKPGIVISPRATPMMVEMIKVVNVKNITKIS